MASKPLMLDSGYSAPSTSGGSGMGMGMGSSPLEQAIQSFLVSNAQQQQNDNPPIETAKVGPAGVNLLVHRPKPSAASQINNTLANMGQQYLDMKTQQKRGQFIQGVHQIMGTNAPREDKMGALMDLQTQYGTDFGLGINSMAQKLGLTKPTPVGKTSSATGSPTKADMVLGRFQMGYAADKNGQKVDLSDPDAMHQYALSQLGGNYDTKYPQIADAIMNKVSALVPSSLITDADVEKFKADNSPVPPASPAGVAPSAPAASPAPAAGTPPAGVPVAAPVAAGGTPAPQVQTAIPGMVYVNPQTGEKRKYVGNGQWQPG